MKISKASLHELWDPIKRNNLQITGVPKVEEREKKGTKLIER